MSFAKLSHMRWRAEALALVRQFFVERSYLELNTPVLRRSTASDPYIESFRTKWCEDEGTLYLQTSPEFAHKIFLSQYFVPIFEIARVFRNEGHGALHRREFSLIEWYKPRADYRDMMRETFELVCFVARGMGKEALSYNGCVVDLGQGYDVVRYRDVFERYAGFNPLGLSHAELLTRGRKLGCRLKDTWHDNDILNCIMLDVIEGKLGQDRPCFLCDYPQSMAALAQTKLDEDGFSVAERFELYVAGVELCNAYSELTDAQQQRQRFEQDNEERRVLGYEQIPVDEDLLSALPSIPPVAGNALGFERLLMLVLGCSQIGELCLDI